MDIAERIATTAEVSFTFETPERWVAKIGAYSHAIEAPPDRIRSHVSEWLSATRAECVRGASRERPGVPRLFAKLYRSLRERVAQRMIDAIDAHAAAEGLDLTRQPDAAGRATDDHA